jgi:hypothetical protein
MFWEGEKQGASGPTPALPLPRSLKSAPAGIDANCIKNSVKWALLGVPADIDITT